MHNKAQLFEARNLQSFGCWMEVTIHSCGLGRRRQGLNIVDLSRSRRRPRNVVDKPKVNLWNIHSSSSVVLHSGNDHHRHCTIKPSYITYLAVELLFLQNSIEKTHCRKKRLTRVSFLKDEPRMWKIQLEDQIQLHVLHTPHFLYYICSVVVSIAVLMQHALACWRKNI